MINAYRILVRRAIGRRSLEGMGADKMIILEWV
jgi:hypothetical protein